MDEDPKDFLFRPSLPRLAEAMRVVFHELPEKIAEWQRWSTGVRFRFERNERLPDDLTNPEEAWEALATHAVIPTDWVQSPQRSFDNLSYPQSIAACVALASDPQGVSATEELAQEFVQRLCAWRSSASLGTHITWRVQRVREWHNHHHGLPIQGIVADMLRTADAPPESAKMRIDAGRQPGPAKAYMLDLANAMHWDHIAAMQNHPAQYTTQQNPFSPLVRIWRLGYALGTIANSEIFLVAAPLDDADSL